MLEPAVRGFLTILEKTFPRSDLYLFELLQARAALAVFLLYLLPEGHVIRQSLQWAGLGVWNDAFVLRSRTRSNK